VKFEIETDNYIQVFDNNNAKDFTLILDSNYHEFWSLEKIKSSEYRITIIQKELKYLFDYKHLTPGEKETLKKIRLQHLHIFKKILEEGK
jgi:hypothetical protein